MFGGMKNKLQEMQQKMEETKARMETISVSATSADEKLVVVANANRKLIDVQWKGEENEMTFAQYNQLLLSVANEALSKAEKVAEAEMSGVAQGMLPNLPGLFK